MVLQGNELSAGRMLLTYGLSWMINTVHGVSYIEVLYLQQLTVNWTGNVLGNE